MKRVQMILEEWQHEWLSQEAQRRSTTISALLRQLLTEAIERQQAVNLSDDPLWGIMGLPVAMQLGLRLRNSQLIEMLVFTAEEKFATWRLFTQYQAKAWSYTDCACLAFAQRHKINQAFTFDHHFLQMGLLQCCKPANNQKQIKCGWKAVSPSTRTCLCLTLTDFSFRNANLTNERPAPLYQQEHSPHHALGDCHPL